MNYQPKSIDSHEEPNEGEINNILTDLSDLFANQKAEDCDQTKLKRCEEVEKQNDNPRGVQNVMLGQPLETWEDLNYFYSLQWKGRYYNSTHATPEFGSFLEDTNYVEEDQDELDSLGLIKAPVEKSQEDAVSRIIQFEPPLTSTTALPPLSTSEVTLNNDNTLELDTQESKEAEGTARSEPNQPPSPLQPASPAPQRSEYEQRSSRQRRKCVDNSRGRGRGRGRGGVSSGQKRTLDMMTYTVPSPADSVSSSGSGGGEMDNYYQGELEGGRNWL